MKRKRPSLCLAEIRLAKQARQDDNMHEPTDTTSTSESTSLITIAQHPPQNTQRLSIVEQIERQAASASPSFCPACGKRVPLREINQHLDDGCGLAEKTLPNETLPSTCVIVLDDDDDNYNGKVEADDMFVDHSMNSESMLSIGSERLLTTSVVESPLESNTDSEQVNSSTLEHTEYPETHESAPYYVRNLEFVIRAVIGMRGGKTLINDIDWQYIHAFSSLSLDARMLFTRLFQRKRGWFRTSKLSYDEINTPLSDVIQGIPKKKRLVTYGKKD